MRELQAAFERRGVRCYFRSGDENKETAREQRRQYRQQELHSARKQVLGEQVAGTQIGFKFD